MNESASNVFCLSAREELQSVEYRSNENSRGTLMDASETDIDEETALDQSPAPDRSTPKTDEVRIFGGSANDNNGGGSECVEFPGESSELLAVDQGSTPPGLDRCRSKWVKLRSTIKVACALTPTTRRRPQLERQDSFLKRFSTRQAGSQYSAEESRAGGDGQEPERRQSKGSEVRLAEKLVINPDESFMFGWLTGIACAVLYNLWTCIAREAFPEIRSGFEPLWYTADGLCDLVYLLDIVVQLRTGYLERGLIVYDSVKLMKHYVYSKDFILDLVSLLPLDLVQIYVGVHPILRFPRFVKSYRLYRFVYVVETRTAFPNMWRVANLSHVLFLGCHWFAAFYFLISRAGNFSTGWGYPDPKGEYASVTQKYLRSLYWSTLTLTTIGDLQSPESNWEFAFTITSYLIGVFVFATIVGQVGNVITNHNACRQEFERHLDGAKAYMRYHNVPRDMQQRVQRWYDYAWSRGRINGGGDINALGLLPDKLKTELALHVNLETLRKVAFFQWCEPEFLHDLVLKMKAYIFTPHDLICRKGEVAREMFIIADGLVEVISDSGEVLKQMATGDFFGEIGILNLDGGVNRRTADVRSLGYSELFVLSRDDVLAALKDHPEAEVLIKEYGQRRLRELDEHKKRRLCERLAKELSTSNTESTASTVGKMVLSTGLLHGIGIAASTVPKGKESGDSNRRAGATSKSRTLPNGSSRTAVDDGNGRWANFVNKIKGNGDNNSASASVQSSRSSSTNTEKKETSGQPPPPPPPPQQGRTPFPVLTLQSDETASKLGRAGTATLPGEASAGPPCRQNVVGRRTASVQGVREIPISRRLAGLFGKRRSAPSRPGKLWSLGVVGQEPAASRGSVNQPQLSSLAPTTQIPGVVHSITFTTPGDNPKPEPTKTPLSAALAQCGPPAVPSSGLLAQSDTRSNANSINKSLDTSNRKGEDDGDIAGQRRSDADSASVGLSAVPLSPPSARTTSKAASECEGSSHGMTAGRPDFQAICSDLSDMIREFVHGELVAMQAEYNDRLQSLEDEIAQKESLIARLRKELDS